MTIENYTLHYTNNKNITGSIVIDSILYNKFVNDIGTNSTGVILASGSFSDIRNYLGSGFFNIIILKGGTGAGNAEFFSHFPYSIDDSNYGTGLNYVIDSHGIFQYIWTSGGGHNVNVDINYAITPIGYEYPWLGASDIILKYNGVMDSTLRLNGRVYRIELKYDSTTNIWTLEGIYFAAKWEDVITQSCYNYFNNTQPDSPVSPYNSGGYSTTGGGDPQKQNWSEDSDYVKEDVMPDETNYSAQSCGLITIFTPSKSQLQRLSDVIWGQGFFNWVQNMVQNISDFFISLGMVPFSITPGQSVEVTWLNYVVAGAASFTDIYLYKCPNQFMEFNMGSIALDGSDDRVFSTDSALDYSPYSKLGIYLPFIGYQELDIDECRNQILTLTYRIDVLSGTTVALIDVGGRTIYQFTGNCLTQLPITSADYQTMVTNAVNLGLSLASAGATGAIASAGDAVAAERISEGSLTAAEQGLQNTQRSAQVASAGGGALSATANAIMGMKPNFKKSGGIGASASLLSVKQPYLFLTTPRQSMPEGYNKVCGFPCNIYGNLGDFSGYTVVEDIRLNGLVATSPEVEEIYQLLKTGVII